ncbi:septum formation protein Maf [candidate division WOR-1 bacterium RIFOXYD2_FULL_36_8]|uniref:dTTP/UTP pyrophosphatase n=1 Tax=candidate division WOR-1 bacterium RIFOXYB2_FULL_36_35 TaxID=1802578 RepID=A0A1F4S139_UNCSA|nr:MAG: septum formation protein Maf [candidate division WOR-1 bacterium RIFOXYA2_FULL_36_21]OGC14156.1 MAG: septum formation protein Maf [candidate division WOR-1 bacterium RIFOXYB2_FULL_36_35]OGC15378.1 MAG: septum formation protein Maf [candidate division WOR-1 bacterium RIFOXYA12_FULL_36_13]OGC40081.1 MAG: septum formation protein Maf [candidate division WOR-1 bacterium RIFOXYD2_FULL_36_8]
MKNKRIILASASPRRKKLLKKIITDFEVITSGVDESKIQLSSPDEFAVSAAILKAKEVALQLSNAIVIGADTIVVLKDKILGKPSSKKDAIYMLKSLSDTIHQVITGIALVDADTLEVKSDFEITKIKMKKLDEKEIIEYVDTGKPLDKAGAYGIQEIEDPFIEWIDGDYDNVVGLPVEKLKRLLCF